MRSPGPPVMHSIAFSVEGRDRVPRQTKLRVLLFLAFTTAFSTFSLTAVAGPADDFACTLVVDCQPQDFASGMQPCQYSGGSGRGRAGRCGVRALARSRQRRFFGVNLTLPGNYIHDISAAGYPSRQEPHTDCFQTFDDSKPASHGRSGRGRRV
jgi:hypothetical protein